MCGIVTIFSYHTEKQPVDREELLRIRDRMTLRGPDGAGEWYSPDRRVGLGHRRLAIIDLSQNGAQPMMNQDASLVITFNGEIYNYRELRTMLESKGTQFRSTSDTEVLLHLYAEKGPELVHDLRGMYAFAIWDARKQGMFLARDPFGIKPLYYADDGRTFRAASQVKALLAGRAIDPTPEPAGHVGFFLWGFVPEPYTLYKNIRAVPAGSYLWVDRSGASQPAIFCSIQQEISTAASSPLMLSAEDVRLKLRESLLDSMHHHLISDVPVAVFLSSGIDSTTLAALASESGENINTVTLGFEEFKGTDEDETPLAELVAKKYGTKHQTIWVRREDFIAERERLLDSMDQPSIDGANTYFVSLAARRAGMKVALSGLGADELFGGYDSFRQIPRMVRMFRPFNSVPILGRAARFVSSHYFKRLVSPKYAGLLEYGGVWSGAYMLRRGLFMPWEIRKFVNKEIIQEGWSELKRVLSDMNDFIHYIDSDHLKMTALEMTHYMRSQLLRDTDWASMAHSLEVRVPFLDIKLLRSVAPLLCLNQKPNKHDMAATPAFTLPEVVLKRKKTGFSIPIRQWLMVENENQDAERGLRGWAKAVFSAFHPRKKRVLALVTDAFGGHGGIALYNRDLLTALSRYPGCSEVVAVPRLMPYECEDIPKKITYISSGINNKLLYLTTVLKTAKQNPRFDIIVCGHINLLPVAMFLRRRLKIPVVLEIYGIDAWKRTKNRLVNFLASKVDALVSISNVTMSRFSEWARIAPDKGFILPNAIHIDRYGPGPKNPALLDRYKLHGKKILMTLGRLVSQERYKGFDEVMDVMPTLLIEAPNLAYLIVGDGNDRSRLEQKARSLGIVENVVFTGLVAEEEKADHYRLADVYVMPSRGEGFGFVFLEAMACGIPVIASILDGSAEAVLNGRLGKLVDPRNPDEIIFAILDALKHPKYPNADDLAYFSFENFERRLVGVWDIIK